MARLLNRKFHVGSRGTRLAAMLGLVLVFLAFRLGITGPRHAQASPRHESAPPAAPVAATVQAAFEKDCEGLVIREVEHAEKEVLVAIYSITRRNITSALADAVKRGVKVRLKYDQAQFDYEGMKTSIAFLKKHGIACTAIRMEGDTARMHHKFVVIDGQRVLTGSYNFTSSATEENYENLVLIESPDLARRFADEFGRIESQKAD